MHTGTDENTADFVQKEKQKETLLAWAKVSLTLSMSKSQFAEDEPGNGDEKMKRTWRWTNPQIWKWTNAQTW